jgi:hypothetical protein
MRRQNNVIRGRRRSTEQAMKPEIIHIWEDGLMRSEGELYLVLSCYVLLLCPIMG